MTNQQSPAPGYRGLTHAQVAQIERTLATPNAYGPVMTDHPMTVRSHPAAGSDTPPTGSDRARSETASDPAENGFSPAQTSSQGPKGSDSQVCTHRRARGGRLYGEPLQSDPSDPADPAGGTR